MMENVDKDGAALKVQKQWRGKVVRKSLKKQDYAAVEIQRVVRGAQSKWKFSGLLSSFRSGKNQNEKKKNREKQILNKKKQFLLIQNLTGEQYLQYEKITQNNSAKILQRAWRNYAGAPNIIRPRRYLVQKIAREPNHHNRPINEYEKEFKVRQSMEDMKILQKDQERKLSERNRILQQIDKTSQAFHSYRSLSKGNDEIITQSIQAWKPEVDALGLAKLQRRIRDAVTLKAKQVPNKQSNRSQNLTKTINGVEDKLDPRNKYQEFERTQFKAKELLEIYKENQNVLNYRQSSRLKNLGVCKSMTEMLQNPLSLEDARSLIHEVHNYHPISIPTKHKELLPLFSLDLSPFASHEPMNHTLPHNESKATFNPHPSDSQHSRTMNHASSFAEIHMDKEEEDYLFRRKPVQSSLPDPHHEAFNETSSKNQPQTLAKINYDGIDAHIEAMGGLLGHRRGENPKWNAVALPILTVGSLQNAKAEHPSKSTNSESNYRYYTTLPLPSKVFAIYDRDVNEKLKKMTTNWASGEDFKDSLRWIAYATQPSNIGIDFELAKDDENTTTPQKTPDLKDNHKQKDENEPKNSNPLMRLRDSLIRSEEQDMALLHEVSLQAMLSKEHRIGEVNKKIKMEMERQERLSDLFQRDALANIRNEMMSQLKQEYSEFEIKRRNEAATKLQAFTRGRKSREKSKALQAERRVLNALRFLLKEISDTGLSSVPLTNKHKINETGIATDALSQVFAAVHMDGTANAKKTNAQIPKAKQTPPGGFDQLSLHFPSIVASNKSWSSTPTSLPPHRAPASPSPKYFLSTPKMESTYHHGQSMDPILEESPLQEEDGYVSSPSVLSYSQSPMKFFDGNLTPQVQHTNPAVADQSDQTARKLFKDNGGYNEAEITNTSGTILPIPSRISENVQNAFATTQKSYNNNHCSVRSYIPSAMLADMKHFSKISAYKILQNLSVICGVHPLISWLIGFAQEKQKMNFHNDGEEKKSFELQSPTSGKVVQVGMGELEVNEAAILLCELACNLGIVNPLELTKTVQSSEKKQQEHVKSSVTDLTHGIMQFCILLKLMSQANDGMKVKLSELYLLIEDFWLQSVPHNGIRVTLQLSVLRYCIIQQAARRAGTNPRSLFDEAAKRSCFSIAKDENKFNQEKVSISISELSLLLGDVYGAGKDPIGAKSTGVRISNNSSITMLSRIDYDEISHTITQLINWHSSQSVEMAPRIDLKSVRNFICSLCSFRVLQKRLQVWFKLVPIMLDGFYLQLDQLLIESYPLSQLNAKDIQMSTSKTRLCTVDEFCTVCQSSNFPLSISETFSLSQLLSRRQSVPSNSNQRALRPTASNQFQSIISYQFLRSQLSTDGSHEEEWLVDTSLLETIREGNFLSASVV